MTLAELFPKSLWKGMGSTGKHLVHYDGGRWYKETSRALEPEHRLHLPYEKSPMERTNQHVKDWIEGSTTTYPCMRKG